jgi:hypothetical protein
MGNNNEELINTSHYLLNTAMINIKYTRKNENPQKCGLGGP